MIKCIALDDQQGSIQVISDHIKKIPELSLVQTFTDAVTALRFLEKNKIHIVFADAQTTHLNGFEFIESVREKKGNGAPSFILTATQQEQAIFGFEQGVVDFLLKPVCFKRFNIAISRLITNWRNGAILLETNYDFFFADANGKKIKINFNDIAYVESAGNYTLLMGNQVKVMIYKSMAALQEILSTKQFIRVHKSYLVSVNYLDSIKGNECILRLGTLKKNIPIGITFKRELFIRLGIKA